MRESNPGLGHRLFSVIPVPLLLAAILPHSLVFLLAWNHPQVCLTSDSTGYLALAKNLAFHQVFSQGIPPFLPPETVRVPGYPLFLAPFTFLFENPVLWIAFAQCVLGSLTIVVAWKWLRSFAGERGALWGALALSLDLVTLLHAPMVLGETLLVFLQLLALAQTWKALAQPENKSIVLCGLLWGAAMLVKPIFMFFPLLLCLVWISHPKRVAVFLLTAYLLPAGWVVRNGVQAHSWGMTSQSGFALLEYPAASVEAARTGKPWAEVKKELIGRIDSAHPEGYASDAVKSQVYGEVAREILKAHPILLARYCAIGALQIVAGTGASLWALYLPLDFKLANVWSFKALSAQALMLLLKNIWLVPIQLAYGAGLLFFYAFSIRGGIHLWKAGRKTEALLLAAGALYLLAVASHQGYSRFRIPIMPFLAGLFACAFPTASGPDKLQR